MNFDEDQLALDSDLNRARYQLYLGVWALMETQPEEALQMYQTAHHQLFLTDVVSQRDMFTQERLRGILETQLNSSLNNPPQQK